MSEQEKRLMELFSKVLPTMTELEKERLMCFGEGMVFMTSQKAQDAAQLLQSRAGL